MIPYRNLGGDSNVIAYQNGADFIAVQFRSGTYTIYTYTYASAGLSAIEQMKKLADAGHGLNSYISRNRPGYASKR